MTDNVIPWFDLKRQYATIKGEIDEAIARVLDSGWFILGPEVEAFEKEFAAYCGCGYGVGVASGTDALSLALRACGIGSGDEVITAPNTAVATVVAIEAVGATPVFVDIDPDTYTMDPSKIDAAITGQSMAIIPVHLYGGAADMNPIMRIADVAGLAVVEDCAQAHGADYEGQKVGTIGDMGCFSFYPTKNLGCYGDGGMVITDSEELAKELRLLRQYGWQEQHISLIKGSNSRLDEMQAAILRVKLRHLDKWNETRQDRARLYADVLYGTNTVVPSFCSGHVYHLYVVRHRQRDELGRHLRGCGIQTNIHYALPVHLMPAYRGPGYFPIAERACDEILSLPMFPELERREVVEIGSAIHDYDQ